MKLSEVMSTDGEVVGPEATLAEERLIGRGLTVVWKQPEGPASELIVQHAEASSADLIALTTHGRGGPGRALFGSAADEILRRAPVPCCWYESPRKNTHDGHERARPDLPRM